MPSKIASLEDFDYDFSALWDTQVWQEALSEIDGGKSCWCTHVCFIHNSLQQSQKGLLFDVPKNYLTRERWS